jgi:catechol 2,3-dioxygenase
MTTTPPNEAAAPATSAPELATFGPVHLDVTDGERSLRFWRGVVGLQRRDWDGDAIALGTRDETLIVLRPVATEPVRRGYCGLYHLALHLPNEPELARMLARLIAHRWPIAPTDHVMSKAIYLSDPDGIGLELTLESPERVRSMRVLGTSLELIDVEGRRRSGREPLDVDELLATLPDGDVERPAPPGMFVGHIHLHVDDLDRAVRFYGDALAFLRHTTVPQVGMADLHAGGRFKHRLAVNIWQGPGAPPKPAGAAGLRHFTIRYDTSDRLRDVIAGFHDRVDDDNGSFVRDPAGNAILLTT